MRKPTNNPITLNFGATTSPYSTTNPHRGTDFAYTPDNKIYAPFSGVVKQVPNNGNDGNGSYMTDAQGRLHGFLHASQYLVPNGANVQEGQAIAVMGETGYAFGKHLHWAVKQNGAFIDPMSTVTNQGGTVLDDKDITAMYLAAGKSEADATLPANLNYYRGKKPEQLANDLYKGNNAGNPSYFYKASHYEADVKASYDKGVADGGGNYTVLKKGNYRVE